MTVTETTARPLTLREKRLHIIDQLRQLPQPKNTDKGVYMAFYHFWDWAKHEMAIALADPINTDFMNSLATDPSPLAMSMPELNDRVETGHTNKQASRKAMNTAMVVLGYRKTADPTINTPITHLLAPTEILNVLILFKAQKLWSEAKKKSEEKKGNGFAKTR